jgi:hypothetical protein
MCVNLLNTLNNEEACVYKFFKYEWYVLEYTHTSNRGM